MARYKEFNIKDLSYVVSGGYGSYYKVKRSGGKLGIKLLKDYQYPSKSDAIDCLTEVSGEYNILVKVSKRTKLVPRPRGLVIVKEYLKENKSYIYHIGYMMTHIKGRTLSRCRLSHLEYEQLENTINSLEKKGIILEDDHSNNVIKSGKQFIFIDADRFYIIT